MEGDIEDEMGKSTRHFFAGALAGTAEHCGMYPIDTIKTHIQAQHFQKGVADTVRNIFRSGGIFAFFRGLTAIISGAAPSHAIYFASYEFLKDKLGGNQLGNHPVVFAISGGTATVLSDCVLCPMDAIKQRRQLNIKTYRGTWDCLKRVTAEEGVKALYAGYTTTLFMNIPFHAIYFNVYEFLRRYIHFSDQYDPRVHFLSGGGAGMVAAGITNPLDVVKTRLQTQGDIMLYNSEKKYHGMFRMFRVILREEGPIAFSRGILPRMIFHSFSASILWTTYEYFKHTFGVDTLQSH